MKKRLYLISTILLSAAVLILSSCLKDSRYVDFSKVGTIVEFPLGGAINFGADAVTATPDTDANGTITQQFAVNISSPTIPTTATTITFSADDPAIITAYDASNTAVNYLPMPSNAYSFTQASVTIPAGQRSAILTVKFYKNLLDPSKSYMLPIAIKSAGGDNISGNQGILYYHFIGNDFAGAYRQTFRRWNAADSVSAALNGASFTAGAATFTPISPTEFTVYTGYDGGAALHYDVTFTKSVVGGVAKYSNFNVSFIASDAAALLPAVTITAQPVFLSVTPNAATAPGPYTFAQALQIFDFQFGAMTTAPRYLVDEFYK